MDMRAKEEETVVMGDRENEFEVKREAEKKLLLGKQKEMTWCSGSRTICG